MSLFAELRRRNVIRVAAAYIVAAWLIVQVVETLFPIYGLPDAAIRMVITLLAIGLLPALVLAWVFEWTPEGLKKDSEVEHARPFSVRAARRLDRLIMIVLVLALGFFTVDKFVLDPTRDAEELATAVDRAKEQGRIEVTEQVRDASIAVLAFQDLSPDGDQAYFSEGLAVDLMNQLGNVPALRVTGKTSAFSFKGTAATIPEISEALNVAHVLDGSVSKVGDRIRIAVQLVDARRDTQIWGQSYDHALGDIFATRDDITANIFDQLTVKFERLSQAALRTDPEVYELTLRARPLISNPESEIPDTEVAAMLERALAIDPDYVPALLESVRANQRLVDIGIMSDEEFERLGKGRIQKVLTIDPDNGTAQAYLAWAEWESEMDLESAARRYSDALVTTPGDLELTRAAGMFARSIGRQAESIALLERCVAADPRNRNCLWQLARAYLWANRPAEFLQTYSRMGSGTGWYYVMLALLLMGEPTRALEVLDSVPTDQLDNPQMSAARAMIMHDLGRHEESAAALRIIAAQVNENSRDEPYLIAQAYAWTGQIDAAFEWLERAYTLDERYGIKGFWFQRIMFLPIWRKLLDDPRWDSLRERMNFSQPRLDRLEFSIPPWIIASVA